MNVLPVLYIAISQRITIDVFIINEKFKIAIYFVNKETFQCIFIGPDLHHNRNIVLDTKEMHCPKKPSVAICLTHDMGSLAWAIFIMKMSIASMTCYSSRFQTMCKTHYYNPPFHLTCLSQINDHSFCCKCYDTLYIKGKYLLVSIIYSHLCIFPSHKIRAML